MSTPSKRKGSAWERDIAKYLVSQGWKHAERRAAGSTIDKGDIYGIIGCVIEAKNEKRIDLAGYLKELEIEMKNAKADTGVVMIKKRGTSDVGQAYAVLPIEIWVALMKAAGY
jgi:Holliday junction resolvase